MASKILEPTMKLRWKMRRVNEGPKFPVLQQEWVETGKPYPQPSKWRDIQVDEDVEQVDKKDKQFYCGAV